MKRTFLKEISEVINRYSKENGSNTPDFILAKYVEDCIRVFNEAVNTRSDWYGHKPSISNEITIDLESPPVGTNRIKLDE